MRSIAGDFPIAAHPGDVLQERQGVSAEMAVMLAKAFGTSPGLWLNLQKNWELSQVDPKLARRVRPIRATG